MQGFNKVVAVLGIFGVVTLGLLGGCVTNSGSGPAGASYDYVPGDTNGYVPNEEQQVIDAAVKVLRNTDIVVISKKTNDQGRTRINGETADGTAVEVNVRPFESATFLSVKVGLIGDDEASGALFSMIRKELGLAVK